MNGFSCSMLLSYYEIKTQDTGNKKEDCFCPHRTTTTCSHHKGFKFKFKMGRKMFMPFHRRTMTNRFGNPMPQDAIEIHDAPANNTSTKYRLPPSTKYLYLHVFCDNSQTPCTSQKDLGYPPGLSHSIAVSDISNTTTS